MSPLAPMTRALPLGSSTVGPISATMPGQDCGSTEGVCPADVQVSSHGRYFSAFGIELQSTASTEPSGSRVNDSSAHRSLLDAAALNVPATGSNRAVCELSMLPIRTRPSARTHSGTSPTCDQPLGVGTLIHCDVTGLNRVAAAM